MKLLLDENIPVQLRDEFNADFDVYTVRYMGWSSLEDSDLLLAMQEAGFDYLITVDKRLHTQHDLEPFSFQIITLLTFSNRIQSLIPFVPVIQDLATNGFLDKNISVNPPN